MDDHANSREQLLKELCELREEDARLRRRLAASPSGVGTPATGGADDQALREREQAALLNVCQDTIILSDLDGRIRMINEIGAKRLGKRVDELIGVNSFDLMPPEVADARRARGEEIVRTRQPCHFEDERAGILFDNTLYPVLNAAGEVERVALFARDVTGRKRAEAERDQLLHAMEERVKELTCLYGVAKSIRERETLEEVFHDVATLIPPGWHYPEITRAKVRYEDQEYSSEPFTETEWKLTSDIVVGGEVRGVVEVYYLEERPSLDEGPFLREERRLIGSIAHALGEAIERKRAEERITAALREKEVLLREIHHRVKNNMQVIISLLRLQARRLDSDPTREALAESQSRIMSMVLIHETLYESGDLSRITFDAYLRRLLRNLAAVHGCRAELTIEAGETALDIDTAVPLGLLVNELVTNAMKHAFPHDQRGEIRVAVRPAGTDELELVVGDDGVGFPEEIDPLNTSTLGLRLVRRLAEDQLSGKLEVSRLRGTRFSVRFKQRSAERPLADGDGSS